MKSPVMRCKMKLHGKSEPQGGNEDKLVSCQFGAVFTEDKEDENYIFGKYTPSGHVHLGIKPEVADRLEIGAEYYVDFTKA